MWRLGNIFSILVLSESHMGSCWRNFRKQRLFMTCLDVLLWWKCNELRLRGKAWVFKSVSCISDGLPVIKVSSIVFRLIGMARFWSCSVYCVVFLGTSSESDDRTSREECSKATGAIMAKFSRYFRSISCHDFLLSPALLSHVAFE
jgi:hypothetical protein